MRTGLQQVNGGHMIQLIKDTKSDWYATIEQWDDGKYIIHLVSPKGQVAMYDRYSTMRIALEKIALAFDRLRGMTIGITYMDLPGND